MYKKKFFFIVFEGVEGTGKSYQINKLYNNLIKKKIATIKTREPGGSNSAELIRNLIFDKKFSKFDKLTDFYLMLASRNEHLLNTIIPAKKKKIVVISDRFTDSTYAYQVVGNKIDRKINFLNQKYITGNLKPNLTIILKSNFKIIKSRLKKRKNKNKFDKLNYKIYEKIQKTFINLATRNKKNYNVYDSSKNNNELEKEIFNLVYGKISK